MSTLHIKEFSNILTIPWYCIWTTMFSEKIETLFRRRFDAHRMHHLRSTAAPPRLMPCSVIDRLRSKTSNWSLFNDLLKCKLTQTWTRTASRLICALRTLRRSSSTFSRVSPRTKRLFLASKVNIHIITIIVHRMLEKFSKYSMELSVGWVDDGKVEVVLVAFEKIQKFFSWINLRLKVSSLCLSASECKQTTGCSGSQVNVLLRDKKEPNRCRRIDSFFNLHGSGDATFPIDFLRASTRLAAYVIAFVSHHRRVNRITVFKISGITWPAEGIRRVNYEIAAKIAQRDLEATLNKAFLRISFAEINFTSEKLKWNASKSSFAGSLTC